MGRFAVLALALAASGCSKLDKLDKLEQLDKLESIEKKFDALTAEVTALRTGKAPVAAADEHKEAAAAGDHAAPDAPKPDHAAPDAPKPDHAAPDAPKPDAAPAVAHGGSIAELNAMPAVARIDPATAYGAHAPAPAAAAPAHAAHPPHWDYKAADTWAALSPEFAACGTGKQQSPIDLQPVRAEASDIVFHYKTSKGSIKDNGHTYQVDLEPGSSIAIDGERYELLQFHVHAPSEHTVAGENYAMELHLVHKSAAGKLAVVGVLVDRGAANAGLQAAWKKLPRPERSEKLKKEVNPASLLPEDRSVYRYAGSLTTPPCSEGVVWNVMRHSVTHDSRDIDVVRARFGDTARPVQAMQERKLL